MDSTVTLFEIFLLAGIGTLAGMCNAIVGGGTLFTFPVLLSLGLPPVTANATNTFALWPGNLGAALGYVPELRRSTGLKLRVANVSVGSLIGAGLLLASGDTLFFYCVPWLLLVATTLFTFSKPIVRRVFATAHGERRTGLLLIMEFACAIYGGYFGAAVGIVLMSAMALSGEHDIHTANAQRNFLVCFINGLAALLFVLLGAVQWPVALVMMAGSLAGGYAGGRLARKIPADALRHIITATGFFFAAYYFYRVYG